MKEITTLLEGFTLDLPATERDAALEKLMGMLMRLEDELDDLPAYHGKGISEIRGLFDRQLPREPHSISAILDEVEEKMLTNTTFNIGPYYQSYITSCSNQAGFMGQVISSFLNQNNTKWHLASTAAELEQLCVEWIKTFMGLPVDGAGVLVSGGSAANLTCLTVARNQMAGLEVKKKGLYGQKPLVLYISSEVHYCVEKSAEMLGIGSDYVRKIPVHADLTINCDVLLRTIEEDLSHDLRPFCVVASAGTVNTGMVDPLEKIADICDRYRLWFHVDGAYGGVASSVTQVAPLYRGLERADSIAVDPHKWLYVPLEAGCALFKREEEIPATYSHVPDYLVADKAGQQRRDYMEYGFQLSRSDRALKIWMTFKTFGASNLQTAIEQDIEKTRYLANKLRRSELFEVVAQGPLSIVCYRLIPKYRQHYTEAELEVLNQKLLDDLESDGRIFITGTRVHKKLCLRSCFVNHRTQQRHLDFTLSVLEELGRKVLDHYQH